MWLPIILRLVKLHWINAALSSFSIFRSGSYYMHNNDIENLFSSPSGCNWDLNERWDFRTNIGFSHRTTDVDWAGWVLQWTYITKQWWFTIWGKLYEWLFVDQMKASKRSKTAERQFESTPERWKGALSVSTSQRGDPTCPSISISDKGTYPQTSSSSSSDIIIILTILIFTW